MSDGILDGWNRSNEGDRGGRALRGWLSDRVLVKNSCLLYAPKVSEKCTLDLVDSTVLLGSCDTVETKINEFTIHDDLKSIKLPFWTSTIHQNPTLKKALCHYFIVTINETDCTQKLSHKLGSKCVNPVKPSYSVPVPDPNSDRQLATEAGTLSFELTASTTMVKSPQNVSVSFSGPIFCR